MRVWYLVGKLYSLGSCLFGFRKFSVSHVGVDVEFFFTFLCVKYIVVQVLLQFLVWSCAK